MAERQPGHSRWVVLPILALVAVVAVGTGAIVATASPSSTSSIPPSTPGPVTASAPVITGEAPPADAVAPPGVAYLAGLSANDVWTTFTSSGYACSSAAGAASEDGTMGWTIYCERAADGVRAEVHVPYWALMSVVGVFMTVLPESDSEMADPAAVLRHGSLVAELGTDGGDRDQVAAWLERSLSDSRCTDVPCQIGVGDARMGVQLGVRGSATIRLDGLSVAP